MHGRFTRVAFLRKERVAFKLIKPCRDLIKSLKTLREDFAREKQDTGKKNKDTRFRKMFKFYALVSVVVFINSFGVYFSSLLRIFYGSLIMFRGLYINFPDIKFFDTIGGAIVHLGNILNLPELIHGLFYPFVLMMTALANIHIDLSSLNVSCSGSAAPFELLIDFCILGAVIIVIESQYQIIQHLAFQPCLDEFIATSLLPGFRRKVFEQMHKDAALRKNSLNNEQVTALPLNSVETSVTDNVIKKEEEDYEETDDREECGTFIAMCVRVLTFIIYPFQILLAKLWPIILDLLSRVIAFGVSCLDKITSSSATAEEFLENKKDHNTEQPEASGLIKYLFYIFTTAAVNFVTHLNLFKTSLAYLMGFVAYSQVLSFFYVTVVPAAAASKLSTDRSNAVA